MNPTALYVGKREDVIREVGGLTHIYSGAFLLQPDGNASYDAEGCDNFDDLHAFIAEYQLNYPDIEIRWV